MSGVIIFLLIILIWATIPISMLLNMPLIRNHRTGKGVNSMFIKCLDSGVKTVKSESHHCTAEFNNGCIVRWWSSNKFYAYADSGSCTKPGGEIIHWSGCMPSRVTVRKLYNATEAKIFDL